MKYNVNSIDEYFELLPEGRRNAVKELYEVIVNHIPKGFVDTIGYGMISFVVPHSIYPKGYHCDAKLPLPFINIASQKNYVALYHMGLYAMPELMNWFTDEYRKNSHTKLDMGKSCIRFKKLEEIPYDLIAQLVNKVSVKEWIEIYEKNLSRL